MVKTQLLTRAAKFFGLATYYCWFISGFSDAASSLHGLTRKDRKCSWGKDQEELLLQIKERLCRALILAYPILRENFVVDTDTSIYGIGGVLIQVDGHEQVIGYFNKVGKAERNYCVTRRELLAEVELVKHFHKYLYGQSFHLRTDHATLR